jgi:hypothetical protein
MEKKKKISVPQELTDKKEALDRRYFETHLAIILVTNIFSRIGVKEFKSLILHTITIVSLYEFEKPYSRATIIDQLWNIYDTLTKVNEEDLEVYSDFLQYTNGDLTRGKKMAIQDKYQPPTLPFFFGLDEQPPF